MRDQEEELHQLKEYISISNDEFIQLSLIVMENEKIQKITEFLDTKESESLDTLRSLNTKTSLPYSNFSLLKHIYVRYFHTYLSSPIRLRKNVIGINPSKNTRQHVEKRHSSRNSGVKTRTIEEYRTLKNLHSNDSKPATQGAMNDDDDDDEEEEEDEHWEHMKNWITQHDQQANWIYDHTICQFQHLSARDNLDPHLQIDPFQRREADYIPYGYTGPMPDGYEYRFHTTPDGPH
nr:zinc finger, CCHC-type [Tanacetum cinerariifolium]